MRKNNLGFSMIELLAAIVILGVLMGVAIPTVINILNDQRNNTYVSDAIKLSTNVDYKMKSDNQMIMPIRGGCVAMNLTYVDNNIFESAPYGGEYDQYKSFVIAKRNYKNMTALDAAISSGAESIPTDEKWKYIEEGVHEGETAGVIIDYSGDYIYFVRLVEDVKGSFRGIDLTDYNALYEDNAKDLYVTNLNSAKEIVLTDYVGRENDLKTFLLDNYGINCQGNINIRASDTY